MPPYNEADVCAMQLEFASPKREALTEGFNKHGVRENDDGSVDVRFDAMKPGVRKGFEITPEFLRNVVAKDYGRIPVQMDHSDSQRANVGYVEPDNVKFNDTLRTQIHIPNTGSSVRDDVIADFTHEPPQITDISAAFDRESLEVEAPEKRGEPVRLLDGRFKEFSLTPFPAGYDEGGITPAFSNVVGGEQTGEASSGPVTSYLEQRQHNLIRK
jgi:hypothetical protein